MFLISYNQAALKYCDLTIRMTLYDKLNNEKINNAI